VQTIGGDNNMPLIVDFRWQDATPDSTNTPHLIEAQVDATDVATWGSSC
jgi:hypothetical protein